MICKNDKKIFALYSCLALLFIYPLIQAGIFYRDDLDRAITGQYGWRGLGRPVAELLMKILSASGDYNLDLFPYTMMVSCIFIGAASLLLKNHLAKMAIPYPIFVAAFLIFNPYMLQNVAYRYDSLGMTLAFTLAVFAYTYNDKNALRQILIKTAAGILALTLYQPCANIFIGLLAIDIIIIGIKKSITLSQSIKLIIRKSFEFILFYLFYMLFFSKKSSSRAELITPDAEGYKTLTNTLSDLHGLFLSYFHGPVYIYFLIPVLFSMMFLIIRSIQNKKSFILPFSFIIFSLVIFLVSLLGPTLLLKEAPVFPRTLVSFSVLLVIIAILIVELCPRFKYLALIPLITTFAFSAQLSSAMKSQREYEDFVFNMISRDIINHSQMKVIRIVGPVNINERTQLLLENKPLIAHFISPTSEFLAAFQLINKGFPQTLHGYGNEQENKEKLASMISSGIKPVSSNKDYSLYIQNDEAVIALGRPNK